MTREAEPTKAAGAADASRNDGGGDARPIVEPADDGQALDRELTVGTVIDGRYRIDEVLGRGAMGVVVAATHVHLGERVALKFLRYQPKAGMADDFQSRFKREAKVSAKLKNEHITRVVDVGLWRDRVPFMAMDYLVGTDLREMLKKNGPLPLETAVDYIVQVCEGIAEAHAHGIVHRDLKPSNLFVTRRPDGSELVKILDFGISKWSAAEAELDHLTQTGVVLGSPKYMAPEQLFGASDVDPRADVWSIGAILYELLGGRPPFDLPTFTKICAELSTDHPPPSLRAQRAEVTPALEAVVMKCFLREPERRPQDVAELAGALLDALGAPFADAVRQRIAATLGSHGGRDPLTTSGGSFATSTASLSLSGGTHAAAAGGVAARRPSPTPAAPVTSTPGSNARRRPALWLLAIVVAVGAGALVYVRVGAPHGHEGEGATVPPPAKTSAGAARTAPPLETTATAPASEAPAVSATSTASSTDGTAPAAAAPAHHGGPWHGRAAPWHAPTRAGTKTAPPQEPATAAATTPPVAGAAPPASATSPAPAPTPTKTVDPLGERE
jgi:serine/threonine protein kinase